MASGEREQSRASRRVVLFSVVSPAAFFPNLLKCGDNLVRTVSEKAGKAQVAECVKKTPTVVC